MAQSGAWSIIVSVGGSLLLLACASAPQADNGKPPESTVGAASAAEPSEPASSGGRAQPPRRLDRTFPDLVIAGRMPGSTERSLSFLQITVYVDVDGRPDMETLRVTGTGAVENRDEIRRWIESGAFTPAKDGVGRSVRGQYKVRIRVGG